MKEIIKITNLSRSFNKKTILNKLNLTVHEGEFIAILGASGSGKSTLLNIIGLLDKKYSGSYVLDGNIIKKSMANEYRSKYISFVFQMYYLIPKLTVKENIVLPHLYKECFDKTVFNESVENAIKSLGLSDIVNQKAETLSGGERQRVAIARTIVQNPKIIICDEPTGNLDDDNTEIIINSLEKQKKLGKTIVIVTHSKYVAEHAEKKYILKEGKLICG